MDFRLFAEFILSNAEGLRETSLLGKDAIVLPIRRWADKSTALRYNHSQQKQSWSGAPRQGIAEKVLRAGQVHWVGRIG